MTTETMFPAAPPTETVPTGLRPDAVSGAMVWNQPGMAGLWGLATAKDSLKYWLKRKSFSSFILTRWIYAIYFVMASLNGFVVFNRVFYSGEETMLASYPIGTAAVLLLVLGTTKERSQGIYFWAAWSFFIFYTLIGFVNATGVTMENYRLLFQGLIKSWIGLIGIPWMAFRVISPDKLPRYTKLLVYAATIGSIMCMLQTANPVWFSYIRSMETMRGAGTWDNANNAGLALMMALFLTRFVDWRSRLVKWTVYLILLAGFIGTFSRGALAGFIFGEMVYLLIVQNYKRMFFAGTFLLLFLSSWVTIGFLVQNNTIKIESTEIRERVQTMSNVFSGKAGADLEAGRLYLWKASVQDVLNKGNLLFGVGHLGLIKSSIGFASHNEYIQYFANGGLLGLLALLCMLGTFVYMFWRCKDRAIRAGLMAMIAGYSMYCMSGNDVFVLQLTGPFFAIFVMWAHYTWEYPGAEKVQRLKKSLTRSLAMANSQAAPTM